MDMTPAEVSTTANLVAKAKGLLPRKAVAGFLAKMASAIDRSAAVKAINKWTPEEAKQLRLFRCDNDPHDGQIVYYEEHGREDTNAGLFKKLRCPVCKHETRHLLQAKRRVVASPYVSGRDRW
jgi:hypothetical protein